MRLLLFVLVALALFALIFWRKSFLNYHLYCRKMTKLYLKYIDRGFDNLGALKEISKIRHPELSDAVHEKLALKFDELGALIHFIYWGIERDYFSEITDENVLALIRAGSVVLEGWHGYRVNIDKNLLHSGKSLTNAKPDKQRISCDKLAEVLVFWVAEMLENEQETMESFAEYIKEAEEAGMMESDFKGFKSKLDRLAREFHIMLMFATFVACVQGISDEHIRTRVLDRYHDLTYETMMAVGMSKQLVAELRESCGESYKVYLQALNNQGEPGPLFHMGKAFLTRAFGKQFSWDISLNLKLSGIFASTLKAVRDLVQNYEIEE